MPKISVIVPVYNVEKYLHRCIDSILAQTFADFELLLVDDGSKDASGSICDEYSEKDCRVRVFHKENGGVSSARNMGLDYARGEWITFVDSDDWISPDCLNEYFKHFDKDADLYIQGFKDNEGHTMFLKEQYWEGEGIACRLQCLETLQLMGFVWNKLFRTAIIKDNKIRFDEKITMIEDLLFVYHYLFYAKFVLNLPSTHYFYFKHTDSACFRKHNFESWDIMMDRFDEVYRKLSVWDSLYSLEHQKMFFLISLDALRSLYIDNFDKSVRIPFIQKIKKRGKNNRLVTVAGAYTFSNKILTFLLLYFSACQIDKVLFFINKILKVKRR